MRVYVCVCLGLHAQKKLEYTERAYETLKRKKT